MKELLIGLFILILSLPQVLAENIDEDAVRKTLTHNLRGKTTTCNEFHGMTSASIKENIILDYINNKDSRLTQSEELGERVIYVEHRLNWNGDIAQEVTQLYVRLSEDFTDVIQVELVMGTVKHVKENMGTIFQSSYELIEKRLTRDGTVCTFK